MNRRHLLKTAMTAVSALATPGLLHAGVGAANSAQQGVNGSGIRHFVFNSQRPESVASAEVAAGYGATTYGVADDLTQLWSQVLNPLWKTTLQPVAGVTDADTFFMLEQLAWAHTHKLRALYKAEHGVAVGKGGTQVRHTVRGPAKYINTLTADLHKHDWALNCGHAVMNCPLSKAYTGRANVVGVAPALSSGGDLVSWILATV